MIYFIVILTKIWDFCQLYMDDSRWVKTLHRKMVKNGGGIAVFIFPVWVVDFFCDIQNNTSDYTKRGNIYA